VRVAIVKPDHGVTGGFEIVVDQLVAGLRGRGHEVDLVLVDATVADVSHLPVAVDSAQLGLFREFFSHLTLINQFEALDVSGYEVVLCTQPGSYAVRHPRKVVLFYHHARSFYDLFGAIEGSQSTDVELHHLAAFIVRDVDGFYLTQTLPILAGSRRIKKRLADHNGLHDNVEVFNAGIDETFLDQTEPLAFEAPVCIGRHEFPKRTELFIHAMKHVGGLEGRVVGVGSQTDRLKGLDAWLHVQHMDGSGKGLPGCPINDDQLWREYASHMPIEELDAARETVRSRGWESTVRFLGRVSRDDLLREYRSALCVVCPAFDEDFGLTCIEAMACGKPVIACHDGGGYVELIEDGVDGFLVEATGLAIAAAIEALRDVELARAMGARGRAKAQAFTWDRAIAQVEQTLKAVGRR
jgi:glycosyltransferase involved in cell wall biosynthesis